MLVGYIKKILMVRSCGEGVKYLKCSIYKQCMQSSGGVVYYTHNSTGGDDTTRPRRQGKILCV
jgi:hypothetical protein